MSRKIIGITVGTTISPEALKNKMNIGSDSGGDVDLTGYATEQYVQEYAQPKGEYLTEVPDGYAKTEDIPTDAEIIQLIKNNAPESSGGGIAVTGATVGQTVKISAVDENGVPTAWESVDFPSGGGGGAERMRFIAKITTEEDLKSFEISEDSEGKPFALNRVAIHMKLQGANGKNANVYPMANGIAAISISTNISGTTKQNFQVMLETLADGNYVAFQTYPIVKDYGTVELGIPFSTSGKSGGYITSVGFMTYQSVLSGSEIAIWGC